VTDWPAWATEQVRLVPSDEEWLHRGERKRRLLDTALSSWLLAPVEHVGSTAVWGLPAKPILDLQAAVADVECAPLIAAALGATGWWYVPPELDRRPWRRFFVQVVDGRRAAHLHVMTLECPRWKEQLAFRDALRADPKLVERYAVLKRTLSAQHDDDREAYSAAKADFVRAVLEHG
jgi:GrpB-like predicted nucleotidyltransferase (UPF0157 family)